MPLNKDLISIYRQYRNILQRLPITNWHVIKLFDFIPFILKVTHTYYDFLLIVSVKNLYAVGAYQLNSIK